jgi:CsoR family transcriptional regulator, copper-sensing transcriptional repressor
MGRMAVSRKTVESLEPQRKHDVLRRLRTAKGHLEGVIGMVEQDAYCIEVLKQLSAIRSALDRVGRIELTHHLERCFLDAVRKGNEREAVDELMETLSYDKELV